MTDDDAETDEANVSTSAPVDESPSPAGRPRRSRRAVTTLAWVGRIGVALLGLVIGVVVGGSTTSDIGPLNVAADLNFSGGSTSVVIPPLGTLEVDAYDGPIGLDLTVLRIDQEKATNIVNGTTSLDELTESVTSELRSTIVALVIKTAIFALLGALVMSLLVYRRFRDALISGGVAIALVAGTLGLGAVTFDSKELETPRYTGLLAQAPVLIGDVEDLATRFADYRKSLVALVTNVSKLYGTVSSLPADPGGGNTIRALHISDVHLNPAGLDLAMNLVKQFAVDLVIDTGDINDWGSEPEGNFTSRIGTIKVPYVFIRGNHDSVSTGFTVAAQSNAVVLDDQVATVAGLRIAGIGDPRFTPDKETGDDKATVATMEGAGQTLADTIQDETTPVDIALVHDPASAPPLTDTVPLVLAGHTHQRAVSSLSPDTLLMVEGSTGGAGLRGLQGEAPTPLEATVLYFDRTSKILQAFDEVTVGGLGETDVSIQRTLAPKAEQEAEESAASLTPTPSGTSNGPSAPSGSGAASGTGAESSSGSTSGSTSGPPSSPPSGSPTPSTAPAAVLRPRF